MQEMAHCQGIRNTNAVDDYVVMNDAGIGGDQTWSANSNDMLEENMLSEHSATKVTHVVTYVPENKKRHRAHTARCVRTLTHWPLQARLRCAAASKAAIFLSSSGSRNPTAAQPRSLRAHNGATHGCPSLHNNCNGASNASVLKHICLAKMACVCRSGLTHPTCFGRTIAPECRPGIPRMLHAL